MNKLKPCPFCGEEDDIYAYVDEVICGSCGCHVGSMHKTKEINIDIWNTRVEAQARTNELVNMLEEMLYSNSTKYREKAEALIAKHRGKG